MEKRYADYVCADCYRPLSECTCVAAPYFLVNIDRNIQDVVRILNEKGYITRYCCEGHDTGSNTYVTFSWQHEFDNIPDGFTYKNGTIQHVYADNKDIARKDEYLKRLLDWAENLPNA